MSEDNATIQLLCDHYDISSKMSLRWIGSSSEQDLGTIDAESDRFIIRVYKHPNSLVKTHYLCELLTYLNENGVLTEKIIPTRAQQDYCILPSGHVLVMFLFHQGQQFETESEGDYRLWGQYVGHFHSTVESFDMEYSYYSPLAADHPSDLFEQALGLARLVPEAAAKLNQCKNQIVESCAQCLATTIFRPIHGDLWPGNLLIERDALRAIDFSDSGLGPVVIDIATAFRWAPMKMWHSWMCGYKEYQDSDLFDFHEVTAFAALQHLRFMIEETTVCMNGLDSPGVKPADYVVEHISAIKNLFEKTE